MEPNWACCLDGLGYLWNLFVWVIHMTEDELKALQERNEARAKEMREAMGKKYLCHPANRVTKAKWKALLRKSKKAQLNY